MPRGRIPAEFTRDQWSVLSEEERHKYRYKKSLEGTKKWNNAHKDEVREQKRAYYQRNKEKLNARSKQYYEEIVKSKEDYDQLMLKYENLKRDYDELVKERLYILPEQPTHQQYILLTKTNNEGVYKRSPRN